MKAGAILLWTPDTTWLQTWDLEGNMRLADLGKLARLSVELFAADHDIRFEDVRRVSVEPVPAPEGQMHCSPVAVD